MNKFQKYISVDDTSILKMTVWNKYRSVTPKIVDEKNMRLRFSHCERVSDISFIILKMYMDDIKNEKKLTKKDTTQLKYIKKNKLEHSVILIGLIHDMYKYAESEENDHATLAATFFKNYCKRNGIKMSGHIKLMYEAILNHSNKHISNSDNIYYKILVDADLLSKYFEENIEQKMNKHKLSAKNEVIRYEKLLKEIKFKPMTPYFDKLQGTYKRALMEKINEGYFNKK